MAEGIVNVVLGRLEEDSIKTIMRDHGCGAENVITELQGMNNVLQYFGSTQYYGKKVKEWMEDARDVAFELDNFIDTVILEEGKGLQSAERESGKMKCIKRMSQKIKNLRDKLNEILDNFIDTVLFDDGKRHQSAETKVELNLGEKLNEICKTINSKFSSGRQLQSQLYQSGENGNPQVLSRPVPADIPEGYTDGLETRFNEAKANVVELLLDKSTPRRLVAIVGPAGIGKTALAKAVYESNEVQSHFDELLWIDVNQEHQMLGTSTTIAVSLGIDVENIPDNLNELLRWIRSTSRLKDLKYLIVLDDVWTQTQLTQFIGGILPKNKYGSRVLVTTRIPEVTEALPRPPREVAQEDDQAVPREIKEEDDLACHIYTLRNLTEEESLQLLLTYALGDASEQPPNDQLMGLARIIVKQCRGYPRPLKFLGIWLHRSVNFAHWYGVLRTLNWINDEADVPAESINFEELIAHVPERISFEELLLVQQLCFRWFVVLPKNGNIIDAKLLLRLWMADELILSKEGKTIEATAEVLLEELVQMGLIQVSERYPDSSIKSCHILRSMRNVVDEQFNNDRYIQKPGPGIVTSSNLRHLLCFESSPKKSTLHKLLGRKNARVRYLEIHWNWNTMEQGYFEKLLVGMNFLQTIDLRAGQHGDLPDCIWLLKSLRQVLLSGYTSGPPTEADLKELQTLTGITNRESWVAGVPKLPNLRVLDILLYKGFHGGRLASFVGGLKDLVSLTIVSEDIPLKVIDMRSYRCYQCLQSLHMREYRATPNNITLSVDMFPSTLVELTLENFRLQQDLMEVLDILLCLQRLRLGYMACENDKMSCKWRGFLQLKELELIALENLKEWEIQKGAMPKLQQLTAFCCPLLRVPEGLKYLTTLRKLSWALHRENDKDKLIHDLKERIPEISIVELSQ